MTHQLLKAEEKEYHDLPDFKKLEEQAKQQKHPYQQNEEPVFVCDPNDPECANRWVQAFGDCA